jgi:hypothetical protein
MCCSGEVVSLISSGACSVSFRVVSFTNVGTCTITASVTNSVPGYAPATAVVQAFTVNKGNQTIAFSSTLGVNATVGTTYTPSFSNPTGNTIQLGIDPSSAFVCSLSTATTVQFIGFSSGANCIITAFAVSSSIYNASNVVSQSYPVFKGAQTISLSNTPSALVLVPGGVFVPVFVSTSALTVTVQVSPTSAAVCSYNAPTNTVSFLTSGLCVLLADQAGNVNFLAATTFQASFFVKFPQTLTFSSAVPVNPAVGSTYTPVVVSDVSLSPIAISVVGSCSTAAPTYIVSFTATGSCLITATQLGNSSFTSATAQQTVSVSNKGTLSVSFLSAAPTQAVYLGTAYSFTTSNSALPSAISGNVVGKEKKKKKKQSFFRYEHFFFFCKKQA